jgi:hypothetical protein
MAKSRREKDLMKRLRNSGVRKSTARMFAEATDGRRKPAKRVRGLVDEMNKVLADVEDRVSGNSAKRKASAKKAAATRKRNAAKRSASAKKGARTRAKA